MQSLIERLLPFAVRTLGEVLTAMQEHQQQASSRMEAYKGAAPPLKTRSLQEASIRTTTCKKLLEVTLSAALAKLQED